MNAPRPRSRSAFIGIVDHAGWAIAVTITPEGELLDRRRIELIEAGLPTMPYHHEAQKLPLTDATALVKRVRLSVERMARASLDELAKTVSTPIEGVALRNCPPLPDTIAERIANYRAMCVADWVVYRQAIANAAQERAWRVYWYDATSVIEKAAMVRRGPPFDDLLLRAGKAAGAPWQKDHRVAMAAALLAST